MPGLVDRIQVIVQASTGAAVSEFRQLESSANKTQGAADRMGKQFGIAGSTLKAGLVAGAAALVGTGLVTFLNDSVDAYSSAAKAAGELALATGSSVEEVSRMQAALEDAGISSEQSAAMLNKFTTQIGKNQAALKELGVEMVRNKDGSIDYAATMVKVVDAIGKIDDAAKRADLLKGFFGKQGVAAFQELYASGMDLAKAMELISKYRILDQSDLRNAQAYDDAIDSLKASVQGLQFSLGRALVPALSTLAELLTTVLDVLNPVLAVLAEIPAEVYLVAGAALLLGRNMDHIKTAAATVGSALSDMLFKFDDLDKAMQGGFATKGPGMFSKMGTALTGMATAQNAVVGQLMLTLTIYTALEMAEKKTMQRMDELTAEYLELRDAGLSAADAQKKLAAQTEETSSTFENMVAAAGQMSTLEKGLTAIGGPIVWAVQGFRLLRDATREGGKDSEAYAEALKKIEEEQGLFALRTAESTDAQKNLNDAVAKFLTPGAEYATTWEDIAEGARDANEALVEQKQITNLAEIAMGQYATSIQQVVEWQNELAGRTISVEEALNDVQQAAKTMADTKDDLTTWGNEADIASGKFEQSLYDLAGAMAETGVSSDQIIAQLRDLQKQVGPEAAKVIETVIQNLTGKTNEVPIDLTLKPTVRVSSDGRYDPTTVYDFMLGEMGITRGGVAEADVTVTQQVSTTFVVDEASKAQTQGEIESLGEDTTANVKVEAETDAASDSIDRLTADKTAYINVSTRGSTEVKDLFNRLTAEKLALIRIETRNGPAVKEYINSLTGERLTLIRIESRNGPAVDNYIDGIAEQRRTAYIDVAVRGAAAARRTINGVMAASAIPQQATGPSTRAEGTATVNNTYSIKVEGAIDPIGTAQTIERVLRKQDARVRGIPSWI